MRPRGEHTPFDLSRLSPEINKDAFLKSLEELQIPCPWGDLSKGEGIPNNYPDIPELNQIPYIPLGLVVGAGKPIESAYQSVANARGFGKIIYSDVYDPRLASGDYVRLDLNDPETINLFGFKVHAIMSIAVFTYDGLGVNFTSPENELAAAQKLTDMLMPGGIFANDIFTTTYYRRFEKILTDQFGFTTVRDTHSIILQKPF